MPVRVIHLSKNSGYAIWGWHGHEYHWPGEVPTESAAIAAAHRQARAAYAHGYRE